MEELGSPTAEIDPDRPNIEDYLPRESIQEPNGKLHLCVAWVHPSHFPDSSFDSSSHSGPGFARV